jgi:hypothetical protein
VFCAVAYPVEGFTTKIELPSFYTSRAKEFYQLDLITPGISPLSANDRKQRRQMPNLRM